MWIALVLAALAVGASSQSCSCGTMKWATCDGDPCTCTLLVGSNEAQTLNCKALIPKCFLMKAEMYQSTGGKPGDNDAIYNPDCENNGTFKAKQCNTEKCWCVNSAGVRRTDKGDKDLKCEKLVETNLVSFLLTHKPVDGGVDANKLKLDLMDAINKRYSNFSKDLKVDIKYYPEERQITINVKPREDNRPDLTDLGYYIERDVKLLPLFKPQERFEPMVGGKKLEIENIRVDYMDEEPPTFSGKSPQGWAIACVVIVVLIILLLILHCARKSWIRRNTRRHER